MASSDEGTEPRPEADDSVSEFDSRASDMKRENKKSDTSSSLLRAARAGNLEKVLELLKNHTDINASNANGLNALHLAAKEGHVAIVEEILKRGANVDAATKKGNTALHIASLAGQLEVIGILLDNGAKVNIQSQNGFTPLYMAAQENHVKVVRYLLSHGALQTLTTEDGFTPLAVALQQGHDKVVAVLLENDSGGKVHLPALHIAAKKDDVKAAKLLLENDHNVDKTSKSGCLANDTTKSGFTPLHIAAHYGNTNVAKLLIEKGSDVNFKARNYIMPLHVSSKWGRANMITLLLDSGAIIDPLTRDGLTPLHCAARSGHEQVVDLLLERGAPVATKTKNGLSPLHMAIQGDHVDCARLLLLHKAPINDVTVDYLTPLHVAGHCGNVKTAKLLLDRKCEVNARALNGFTPLHIACKKNRIKVVELLLKYGATIEATTESGLTPIHVASFMGHMNIVIFLIQHGANPDCTTVRGETALHLAARANQTDIIRILLRNGAQVDARAREQQTPLHIASRLGNVDNVLLLLQHGASPDAAMKDLSTPLHIAAKEGHDEVAMILLEHGASQNLTTKKGFSTLHVAAKFGRIKVARLLLEKGADPNVEGRNGLTPLHVATHYNHINVALLLLEKDANSCIAAKNGYTALHIASKKNQMDIATTLFQYGAKPNAESHNGFTPLHLATQEGHTDMVSLLLEHEADVNCKAKNGLTPMHLAAQEDAVPVAEILVKFGSQIDSQTKAGYTPLHTACHFGQVNMIRFLLDRNANMNVQTKMGYTPLHHAAQQGHLLVVKLLLKYGASPNNITNTGQTAMSIAQRLGYISVVEILRPVTDATASQVSMDEKYKVISPEIMQEAPMSDSEDEGCDENALPDQSFHYLVSGDSKQYQDDSITPAKQSCDLFGFEGHMRKQSMSSSMGPGIIHEEMKYMRGEEDGVDGKNEVKTEVIMRRHVGGVSAIPGGYQGDSSSRPCSTYDVDNVIPTNSPSFSQLKWKSFLVSFLVDARGGAMRGCRHSGVRIVVPPNCALMPTRITCRLVKREKLMHPPPLMEGEALASRVLEMGPVGVKLLRPMVIEVPHFAALHGDEREIAILRSDDGLSWREHVTPPVDDAAHDFIQSQFEDLDNAEDMQTKRLVRVVTSDFPQYFALVSRVRQDVGTIGSDGGVLSSKVIPQVQAVFPPASFNKITKVGLQAQLVPPELVSKLLGNRVAVSPLVTIEPRRRKFHKPITLTIPLPKAAQKGMLNQYGGGDAPNLRLLCSVSGVDTFSYLRGENGSADVSPSDWKGGVAPSVWEDITGSTPLTLVNDCVSFTTSVSARFWLMDCQNINDSTKMATDLYREVAAVPFMSRFVVFAKHLEVLEARLRVFCMTDDRIEKTLENQEHFVEVARSRDIEVLEDKPLFLEMGGNLIPVTKSGDQLYLVFHAFHENRLPFIVRIRDLSQETKGRLAFMKDPKVPRGDISESPVCNLNIRLPGRSSPGSEPSDITAVRMMPTQFSMEEHIAKAELKLTDIADLLQADWIPLADQLGVSDNEVTRIQSDYEYVSEQALVMLHMWVQKNENRATGNDLERALKHIGRDDVIASCMYEVKEVTDATEKAVARVYLDASYDPLKDEMGSSHEFDSSRGSSMLRGQSLDVSYDEQDMLKDSESFAEETGSETGSVIEREDFEKKADTESAEYELEEVWDGTQWNVVRKTLCKDTEVECKTSPDTRDASYELKSTREVETARTMEPADAPASVEDSGKTEEVVDLEDWEVVDELPADVTAEGDVTPGVTDVAPDQPVDLEKRQVVEVAEVGGQDEGETEEEIRSNSEVHEEESFLEDGTNMKRRITTTRQVRVITGKSTNFPKAEELLGTEIEEEILLLAPGVVQPFDKDLQRETSVEEFEETLPDGTWARRKVTTVTVKPFVAPAVMAESRDEEQPAEAEGKSVDHSEDQDSSFSYRESFPVEIKHSDSIEEEKIIPQMSGRPERAPKPQDLDSSSQEEEEEEDLVEKIEAIKAEYQYSTAEDFGSEEVEEPVIVREASRKIEVSVEELFSKPPPPEISHKSDSDELDYLSAELPQTSSSSDQFLLGLNPPCIAFQAASPLVQSPAESIGDSTTKLEDEQEKSTEEFLADDVIALADAEIEERNGSPAAEPDIEMDGRISVDTSQQIFIEQMIEASRGTAAMSPGESRPSEFSVVVERSSESSSLSQSSPVAVDFSRDLTIRPTDLSPLTPTPEPTEQNLPSLFDTAPSPRDQNEMENWAQVDGADDEEASSLSEVAQVDDVSQSQELAKEVEAEEKSDETDVDEAFSPAPKDNGFDPQRSISPTVLSQSPPERISPSKELALKEDVSPVTEQPRDMRKMRINVGLSPSGFIQEEDEEEEEVVEEEEEEEEDRVEVGSGVNAVVTPDNKDVYFKPISPSHDDEEEEDNEESKMADEAVSVDESSAQESVSTVILCTERRQNDIVAVEQEAVAETDRDDVSEDQNHAEPEKCDEEDAVKSKEIGAEFYSEMDEFRSADDASKDGADDVVALPEKDEDELLADEQKDEEEFSGDEEAVADEGFADRERQLSASNLDEDLGYVDDAQLEYLEERDADGGGSDEKNLPCDDLFQLDAPCELKVNGFRASEDDAQTTEINGEMHDGAELDLSQIGTKEESLDFDQKEGTELVDDLMKFQEENDEGPDQNSQAVEENEDFTVTDSSVDGRDEVKAVGDIQESFGRENFEEIGEKPATAGVNDDENDDEIDEDSYDLVSANELEGFQEYEAERLLHESLTAEDLGESSKQTVRDPEHIDMTISAEVPSDAVQSWNSNLDRSLETADESFDGEEKSSSDLVDRTIKFDDRKIQTNLIDADDRRNDEGEKPTELMATSMEGSYINSSQSTELSPEFDQDVQHSSSGDTRIEECLSDGVSDFKPKDLLQDPAGVSESSGRDSWMGSSGGAELWSETERAIASGSAADEENFVFLDESGYDPIDPEDAPPESKEDECEDDVEDKVLTEETQEEERAIDLDEGSKDADFLGADLVENTPIQREKIETSSEHSATQPEHQTSGESDEPRRRRQRKSETSDREFDE